MIDVHSPLDDELEVLIHTTIGCCITVHRELGPGLLEDIYARAVCIELAAAGVPFEKEKQIAVFYRGRLLAYQRLDIVVAQRLILEIKSVERIAPVHRAQVLSYLRASRLRIALLMNFNVPTLPNGLHRIVL
jgi:GxxExxY protein